MMHRNLTCLRSSTEGAPRLADRRRERRAHRFAARLRRQGLAAAVLLVGASIATWATAGWPPEEHYTSEDMADPANWPNDPSYAYSDDSDGHWNYYSFVPEQTGPNTVRPEETASGMSIDLAWRWTQGQDAVRIAVTDSGIKWNEYDLLERAWLNPGELENHKPTNADGSPCGGSGELEGFDCNGDGILSASDYAETPTLEPPASDGHPLGDLNGNGRLDGGDLIMNFSDSVDDDQNGYVDDISGWDFMKDDNNPYDDTRYGHGTGEARDATAEGNNGQSGIGVCPKCRFIAMRVGDSFIADVNAFAQAVIYATDNGAKVVQCALGTINTNRFSQAALDYAYQNGVVVVASMADENARHHNVPVTSNHTLPAHAITYSPGSRITSVETFLAFNTCTNYGGQNLLSVSGTGCSSEAVGRLSGMTGLVFSEAIEQNLSPPLTAAEAYQLFIVTADDIDVPESREEDGLYYWSQPGFDQRFGYGRTNANTAVEYVKDGKIPPEVDIVSPRWFDVLYPEKVSGAVPIRGHVSAKRAHSYDVVVEWAPGVQPLDGAFQEIASETNIPPTVVTGGEDALALLDIRTISTEHEADNDSPNGENEHTITVRVRAVAHYGGEIGDVPGEMRRTYYVYRDPTLVDGFPVFIGDSGEGSAKLVDLDGDGIRDLLYPSTGGELHAYRITASGPVALPGFPFKADRLHGLRDPSPPEVPSYLGSPAYDPDCNAGDPECVDPDIALDSFVSVPAVADMDGDGELEIAVNTWKGTVYVLGTDGQLRPGWPIEMPVIPSCPRDGTEPAGPCSSTEAYIDRGAFASPVLADMNKDGELDLVQAGFDGKVYVWDADGQPVDGWPVDVHYTGELYTGDVIRSRILTTPAIEDFNGDGYPEVLVSSTEMLGSGSQSGATYLIDGRGTAAGDPPWLENWPVTMTSFNLFPLIAEGVANSGVIGDFDGTRAAITHGNASPPLIVPADPGPQSGLSMTPPNAMPQVPHPSNPGETRVGVAPSSIFGPLSEAFRPNTMLPLFSQPALGDVDQDGCTDVIASGGSLNMAINLQAMGTQSDLPGEHLLAVWSGRTGDMLPASPYVLEDYSFFNSMAVADLNDDDYPEVIAGSGGYFLHAWDGCGREPEGWPKFTGQWIISTPAVGDLDGDGKLEVVVGTRNGWLYAWHTEGREDGIIEWESYHHDNRNTGSIETPLDQGDPDRQAAQPLSEALCRSFDPALAPPLEPDGGCAECALGRRHRASLSALLAAGLLALAAAARRRRRA